MSSHRDDPTVELCQAIRKNGFLYSADGNAICDRRGFQRPWVLYLWQLTMTSDGCALLASALLPELEQFGTTTLAAYGTSAVPLMMACVAHGSGRYQGLVVRSSRKTHGALRQVDGGLCARRVVVIDDSISSGTSFRAAATALENNGYEVAGTLVVVDFPYRGGREWAEALGYRVKALLNIWTDLGMPQPAHTGPEHLRCLPGEWSSESVPDGLHPAHVARLVAEHYLGTGDVLRPPRFLGDREGGAGGTWVSFRRRDSDARLGRGGFWHFDPLQSDPLRDVVLATIKTVRSITPRLTLANLVQLKIAVTFFGPLELIDVAGLDFLRYGIVVRSRVTDRLGGALPNTQHYTSTIEQYRHARETNAGIGPFEPHDILRHEVVKRVEPGETWLAYGVAATEQWAEASGLGTALTDRAAAIVTAVAAGLPPPSDPLPASLLPEGIVRVGVTIYSGGLHGCSVAEGTDIDDTLVRAATGAVFDRRLGWKKGSGTVAGALVVSLLHDAEKLGERDTRYAAWKLRAGRDSLSVEQGDKRAIFLENVVPHRAWTKIQSAEALLEKAGILGGPTRWTTYKTESWVAQNGVVNRLDCGACRRDGKTHIISESDLSDLASHLVRRLDLDGWPAYRVDPWTGKFERNGASGRCCQALVALYDAGVYAERPEWVEASLSGVAFALSNVQPDPVMGLQLPHHVTGHMGDAMLLWAACAVGAGALVDETVRSLARRIRGWIRDSGEVRPEGTKPSTADADYLPGVALLALAQYSLVSGAATDIDWSGIRAWYERRFRAVRGWGLAGGHCKLWSVVAALTGDQTHLQFSFELADWMVSQQLRSDGSFPTDLDPFGPGFHTAAFAEGAALVWKWAEDAGEMERAGRYERSWRAAMGLMDRLMVRKCDTYWMPDPVLAAGAVRRDLTSFDLRVDYVAHTLNAVIAGLRASSAGVSKHSTVAEEGLHL